MNTKIATGFMDYESMYLQNVLSKMKGQYKGNAVKEGYAKALCFWQYLRSMNFENKEKLELYKELKDHPNKHIATIVAMEVLPEKVWRKLLWRKNIDFMSFESFLRRLSDEQRSAIFQSAEDLYGEKLRVPQVFRQRIFDFVLVFLGIITAQKLINGWGKSYDRYTSKGAWAFNLLGIDFGFGMYPYGDNDDRKITNQKWTRFLSIKEHINDFTVNQEDGIYWWLYRMTRSYLTFRPKNNVSLKSHVCPGFWATLIFHFYFWIASPIVTILFFQHFNAVGYKHVTGGWYFLEGVFCYTPIYLGIWSILGVMAGVVILIGGTAMLIGIPLKKIGANLEKQFKKIVESKWFPGFIEIVKYVLLTFLACLVLFGTYKGSVWVWPYVYKGVSSYFAFMQKYLHSGILQTLLFTTTVVLAFLRMCKVYSVENALNLIAKITGVLFAVNLLDSYVMHSIVSWFGSVILWIYDAFVKNTLVSIFMVLLFAPFILTVYLMLYTDGFGEKDYARQDKFIRSSVLIWSVLMIVIFVVGIYTSESFSSLFSSYHNDYLMPFYFLIGFMALMAFILYLSTEFVNSQNIDELLKAEEKAMRVVSYSSAAKGSEVKSLSKSFRRLVLENKWLMGLDEVTYSKVLSRLKLVLNEFLQDDDGDYSSKMFQPAIVRIVLSRLNEKNLAALEKVKLKYSDSEKDRRRLLIWTLQFESFEKAKKNLEYYYANEKAREEMWQKRKDSISRFINFVIWPFMVIYKLFRWIFVRIGRFFGTLRDLWDLFNKRCPEVAKQKSLKYD